MRSRFLIPAVIAVGSLFGWLAASGRFAETFGQDTKAPPTAADGKQLPKPDPAF